jgi:arylsulfatase A-like enzyme
MEANMADLPNDKKVIKEAITRFNEADPPRFLWVHQMGSHRPYGTGKDALPGDLDRKAEAAGGHHWFGSSTVTEDERKVILEHYRDSLRRVDNRINRLLESVDTIDPLFVFTSDHGDEFGEDGYYYHQGFRRRVADSIIRVPVIFDGIDTVGDRCSLLDIPPTVAGAVDSTIPKKWQGNNLSEVRTDQTVTVAPWNDQATVAWQDFERKLIASDADVSMIEDNKSVAVEQTEVSPEIESQLKDLGYTGSG